MSFQKLIQEFFCCCIDETVNQPFIDSQISEINIEIDSDDEFDNQMISMYTESCQLYINMPTPVFEKIHHIELIKYQLEDEYVFNQENAYFENVECSTIQSTENEVYSPSTYGKADDITLFKILSTSFECPDESDGSDDETPIEKEVNTSNLSFTKKVKKSAKQPVVKKPVVKIKIQKPECELCDLPEKCEKGGDKCKCKDQCYVCKKTWYKCKCEKFTYYDVQYSCCRICEEFHLECKCIGGPYHYKCGQTCMDFEDECPQCNSPVVDDEICMCPAVQRHFKDYEVDGELVNEIDVSDAESEQFDSDEELSEEETKMTPEEEQEYEDKLTEIAMRIIEKREQEFKLIEQYKYTEEKKKDIQEVKIEQQTVVIDNKPVKNCFIHKMPLDKCPCSIQRPDDDYCSEIDENEFKEQPVASFEESEQEYEYISDIDQYEEQEESSEIQEESVQESTQTYGELMYVDNGVEHYELGGNDIKNRLQVFTREEPVVKPPADKEQEICDAFDKGNVIIEAFAGCGKTYTLLQLAEKKSKGQKWAYLVFNRKNAEEAKEKFPSNVKAFTFNGFCGEKVEEATKTKRMPMNKSKLRSIIYQNWPKDLDKKIDNKSAPALLQKLIERCKSFMLTHKSPKQVILERCAEITKADLNEYIDYIVFVLEMCQYNYKGKGKIPSDCSGKRDTDDDLYWFALIDSIKISKLSYKCVLIDEVQDSNECQMMLVKKLVDAGIKVVCVGDRYQSIYGFRGTSGGIFTKLQQILNKPTTVKLEVNFRCSPSILKYQNEVMPTIRPTLKLNAGIQKQQADIVTERYGDQPWITQLVKGDEYIIARHNKELQMCAVQLVKKGFMFAIKGLSLAKYFDDEHTKRQDQEPQTADEESSYFDLYTYIETELYDSNIDESVDQFDRVYALIKQFEVAENSTKKHTCLMTIHKSKGLEHDNVIVLKWNQRDDLSQDEIEEEHNCLYIAYTRARRQLHVINTPKDVCGMKN